MYEFLISSVKKELNIPEKSSQNQSSPSLPDLTAIDVSVTKFQEKRLFPVDDDTVLLKADEIHFSAEENLSEFEFNQKSVKNDSFRQRIGHSLLSEKARRMKAFITNSSASEDIVRFVSEEEMALNRALDDHSERKSGDESALRAAYLLEEFWHKKELLITDSSLSTEERARQLYDFAAGFSDDIDRFITLYLEKIKDRFRKKKIQVYIDRYRKLIAYFEDVDSGRKADDSIFKEMGL